jgi:hypothetical protein
MLHVPNAHPGLTRPPPRQCRRITLFRLDRRQRMLRCRHLSSRRDHGRERLLRVPGRFAIDWIELIWPGRVFTVMAPS